MNDNISAGKKGSSKVELSRVGRSFFASVRRKTANVRETVSTFFKDKKTFADEASTSAASASSSFSSCTVRAGYNNQSSLSGGRPAVTAISARISDVVDGGAGLTPRPGLLAGGSFVVDERNKSTASSASTSGVAGLSCSFGTYDGNNAKTCEDPERRPDSLLLRPSNVKKKSSMKSDVFHRLALAPEVRERVGSDEQPPGRGGQLLDVTKRVSIASSNLTDPEVLDLVRRKQIAPYALEDFLNDRMRGVRIRRAFYDEQFSASGLAAILGNIPFEDYEYDLVAGACCENVVGYVGIPVGIVGPLVVDGNRVHVPLATTEGCLVASVNRGAAAVRKAAGVGAAAGGGGGGGLVRGNGGDDLDHRDNDDGAAAARMPNMDCGLGIRTDLYQEGMTRAPVLEFPNAMLAGY